MFHEGEKELQMNADRPSCGRGEGRLPFIGEVEPH
jgi:hypothetical protein